MSELMDVNVEMFFRNCIVCRGCTVKVSDLGSGRSAYAADYFRIEGRPPLPIRWMAWESMLMVSVRRRHGCLFHVYTYLNYVRYLSSSSSFSLPFSSFDWRNPRSKDPPSADGAPLHGCVSSESFRFRRILTVVIGDKDGRCK